ncbi:MAG: DUF2339 domain-containing protein [Calditrichia bacterium]
MNDNKDKIELLLGKLETLLQKQESFAQEVQALRSEIHNLTGVEQKATPAPEAPTPQPTQTEQTVQPTTAPKPQSNPVKRPKAPRKPLIPEELQKDLEKFIGENLINKIGIAILILGVAIGAKYSIDNNLISPLTRIILGYLSGLGLLGFGMKLRKKYESYSAVLVSGAMAIFYFLTFAAYSFYGLIPQSITFALMVIFTAFTVFAALSYNQQAIAHIGLVGAYAVPFLLSDGSGKVAVLFTYMAIINIGILFTAFKRYWKPLYYVAFGFTWLIFLSWYSIEYRLEDHFGLALTFAIIFFATFYLTFLAYKLIRNEQFQARDVQLLLANSFTFYGVGYSILSSHEIGMHLLGLFTLLNAVVHFIVSAVFYRRKLADRNLFYLASGLVLVFITIAIPVQLDGNWVTLLWVGEAALLYWIGKTKNIGIYEKLSYPLMALAFFSILHDWSNVYDRYDFSSTGLHFTPVFNIHFLSSLLFIAAFAFIVYLQQNKTYPSILGSGRLAKFAAIAIPATLLYVTYSAFHLEIGNYFEQRHGLSAIADGSDSYGGQYYNYDLLKFKNIWLINYSLLFLTILAFFNIEKLQNRILGIVNLGFSTFAIAAFLLGSLYSLGELRSSYINQSMAEYYNTGIFHLVIRYIAYGFVALTLFSCYKYTKQKFMQNGQDLVRPFDLLLHISLLWLASSELIHWLDLAGVASDKLGLSILWGVYSLALIAFGIWKGRKHLRIGAIALFGVTLLKLFAYDIADLNTIAKTVVFMSLGLLLLTISFLYNKYKHLIVDENENKE